MTQDELVIRYIDDFGSISSREAFLDLGVSRLAACIYRLKKRGMTFERVWETSKNRYDKSVSYVRYRKAA